MKKIFSAFWKILLLTIVYFILNAIMGMLLPLSNDMTAAMTPEDQAAFMPPRFSSIWWLCTWYWLFCVIKAGSFSWVFGWPFGVYSTLSMAPSCIGITRLFLYLPIWMSPSCLYLRSLFTGQLPWLVGGFKREATEKQISFDAGRYAWKVILFCVAYSFFYYGCGFITRLFPAAVEFYAGWAATMEPLYMLLSFNVFRGALWLVFSLPILLGARTRKVALWLMPLMLFNATAMEHMLPSAVLPGGVRLAHFIELGSSMIVVGLFMVWLFVKDKAAQGDN
jgi:hypothetical protein